MPSLRKRALSLYLRNGCQRQFVLYLYTDDERTAYGMPSRQQRGGLRIIGKAGYEWQEQKVNEIKVVMGNGRVIENSERDSDGPKPISLANIKDQIIPFQFIVEAEYEADTTTFRRAIGIDELKDYYGKRVEVSDVRPDIVQILPPMSDGWSPTTDLVPNPYELSVSPNGDVLSLAPDDQRLRLRVIDVKLTSEPGANYFGEVVYYSMTLAAWLVEQGLQNRFVVVAAPAVWPGKYEASSLDQHLNQWKEAHHSPTDHEKFQAIEFDLEIPYFDVFSPRIRSFLATEFPKLMSKPWNELSWHVDYRCKGCEFLSAGKPDERAELRCYAEAERDNDLSRVFGLSRGAKQHLKLSAISDTSGLAALAPESSILGSHQGLRVKRTAFPHRAAGLALTEASIIPHSGGDALMPKWPDLRIYLFLDYDLSSAITVTMAVRANWREPLPYGSSDTPATLRWPASDSQIYICDIRSIDREREEFLKFLGHISSILNGVATHDAADENAGRRDKKTKISSYQIFLWDESQRKHLVRLISRHFSHILQDPALRQLIWLFPPPEVLPDAEEASRKSAITILKTVIENTVSIPEPHQYDLISLAQYMKSGDNGPSIHDLYTERFSDLIPMERIHEYWTRYGNWSVTHDRIVRATKQKTYALDIVQGWLQDNLSNILSKQAAPKITPHNFGNASLPLMSRLWIEYTRLNASLSELDADAARAMPPHERQARFRSALLTRRLDGQNRSQAMSQVNEAEGTILIDQPSLWIYEMHPDSVDVNIQRGDFLLALTPMEDYGFLDRSAFPLVEGTDLEQRHKWQTIGQAGLTSVSVKGIDRTNRLIALEVKNASLVQSWEQRTPPIDFSSQVTVDKVSQDFLTGKIETALKGINHPPSATPNAAMLKAFGLTTTRRGNKPETPASTVLWSAPQLCTQATWADVRGVRSELEAHLVQYDSNINTSQWAAWEATLSRTLTLIWGPPGTGKSRTLRTVVLGWLLAARKAQRPLRVLVTANTYTAIDNVLHGLERDLRELFHSISEYSLYRVQSSSADPIPSSWVTDYPTLTTLVLNRWNLSNQINQLRGSLNQPSGLVVVGCTPQQLYNLAIGASNSDKDKARASQKAWFDVIVVDEASQIDAASGALIFSARDSDGVCVIAGDDKQLPPIYQARPPEGLENVVGSLYSYFREYHQITPVSLDINYRSNRTIVEFSKVAGYSANLRSASPDLMLNLQEQFGLAMPENWPSSLYFTPDWEKLLDPRFPTTSFVYNDELSTQVNDFEADATTALIWILRQQQRRQLLNELKADGSVMQDSDARYTSEQFWTRAVGVVTPHRAQRSRVITRLKQIFPQDPANLIGEAVDTVERYQGQERDVIIASFGVGDPDIIQSEDEFLYNLNRFNVLTSRARAKVILFCTDSLVKYLSNDPDVLRESRLLKIYVESFCRDEVAVSLGYYATGNLVSKLGILRLRFISE